MPLLRRHPRLATLLAGLAVLTGCTSDNSSYHEQVQAHATQAAKQPTMTGESRFFDNTVDVEVRLGRGFRPRVNRALFEARDNPFEVDPESKEDPRYVSIADDDEYFIPRMHNSTLPPHALRLRVSNDSQEPVEIEYLECNSSLGNFVVKPSKATLEPGQSHEPNAMISLLGATGEPIPVKITLARNGKVESQVLTLRLVASNTAPAKK